MNKLILDIGLMTLPKEFEDRYQLNIKILYLNELFMYNSLKESKYPLHFNSSYGFIIYSNSYGKIFPDTGRLRLPESFFYSQKNPADNIITCSFKRDLHRYEYLRFLKDALEEWSEKWEGFVELNKLIINQDYKIRLANQFWII